MAKVRIGQQGSFTNDNLESALDHVKHRYNRFYRMLYDYDEGFGHFYYLDDYRKDQILRPFRELLNCTNLDFYRMERNDINDGKYNHYDFYVGQSNRERKRHGIGFYSWEWEQDDDGDTSITYFIGRYENGQRKNGVWYHLSNEDAKIWVEVEGCFYLSALRGMSIL